MAYCVADDLKGLIPDEWLTEATDDDGDGERDAIADVLATAHDEVDAKLCTRYTLPLDLSGLLNGMMAKLRHITRYLAAEVAYGRRGMAKEFPWMEQTKSIRKALDAIEAGTIQLYPNLAPANDDAVAITALNPAHGQSLSF